MRNEWQQVIVKMISILLALVLLISQPPWADAQDAADTRLKLTVEEQAWIQAHPQIKVHTLGNYPPFEMIQGGKHIGLAIDYLNLISQKTGLTIQLVQLPWHVALEEITRKQPAVDVLLGVTNSPDRAQHILLTQPYLVAPHVVITRKDGDYVSGLKDLAGKTVVMEKAYMSTAWVKKALPHNSILEVDDTTAALRMVSSGKADAYIGNLAVASYQIDKQGFTNLKVASPAAMPDDALSMGIRKDWPELASILNKALSSIPPEEHQQLRQKWLAIRYEHGISPKQVVIGLLALISIALALIIPLKLMVKRRTQELEESKGLLESITDNTLQLQGLLDLDGTIVKVNRAALTLAGCDESEVIGRLFWEAPWWKGAPQEQLRLMNAIERAKTGEICRFETINHAADGSLRNIDFSLRPLADQAGQIRYLVPEGRDVTDLKQALLARIQSEKETNSLFMAVPVGVACIENRIFKKVNDRFCQLTGYTEEELIGQSTRKFYLSDEEFQSAGATYYNPNRSGVASFEMRIRHKSGREIPVSISTDSIGRNAQEQGLIITVTDLTERIKKEQEFQELHERFKIIFDEAPITIVLNDLETGAYTDVNKKFLETNGIRKEEIIGTAPLNSRFFNPEENLRLLDILNRYGKIEQLEMPSQFPDGSQHVSLLDTRIVTICEKKYALSMLVDITERKQAESALKESEAKYRLLFESAPVGIFQSLPEGRFVSINQTFTRIFGYTSPEEMMELVTDIPTQVYADASQRVAIIEQIKTGTTLTVEELKFIRKDGTSFWGTLYIRAVKDQLGSIQFMEGFLVDITERKLAQELMIQHEKMTTIAGLAAGIAHEINNPLGIIVQDLQLIERRLAPNLSINQKIADEVGIDLDTLHEYLKKREIIDFIANMRTAGQRASTIVRSMLQFGRTGDDTKHEADLTRICEQAIALASSDYDLKKSYDFKNVVIVRDFADNLPPVRIVASEIEQVLINLFKNAAQALYSFDHSDSPATIAVRTRLIDSFAEIMVSDNGPGIPEAIRGSIFEPFFTTKEVGVGTGLGLAVSYAIVTKKHGGTFSVACPEEGGTCFTIQLPLAEYKEQHHG